MIPSNLSKIKQLLGDYKYYSKATAHNARDAVVNKSMQESLGEALLSEIGKLIDELERPRRSAPTLFPGDYHTDSPPSLHHGNISGKKA